MRSPEPLGVYNVNMTKRPSGLVTFDAPEKEVPEPLRTYYATSVRRHDDMLRALGTVEKKGAQLISVVWHERPGNQLMRGGYVITYYHREALGFEEKC